MSVFGGDSWAREAQQRKRRVDDLMLSSSSSSSISSFFKKLSNGTYACLVCRHAPIFTDALSLSLHAKGARHIAAESRLKERELSRQEELNKRIALSSGSTTPSNSATSIKQQKGAKISNKPLIEQTRKAILEAQSNRLLNQNAIPGSSTSLGLNTPESALSLTTSSSSFHRLEPSGKTRLGEPPKSSDKRCVEITEDAGRMLIEWNEELKKHREKELKFTAAGWKRDGYGKWYKDENVEFDSDEEDPNICFS